MIRNYRNIPKNNSFIVGLAGGISQVEVYSPTVYIDEGEFTYFYIDFKRPMRPFSYGMVLESIKLYTQTGNLTISGLEQINNRVYKIYCNLQNHDKIVIENLEVGWLYFQTGKRVPPFIDELVIDEGPPLVKPAYVYQQAEAKHASMETEENILINFSGNLKFETIKENTNVIDHEMIASHNVVITMNP